MIGKRGPLHCTGLGKALLAHQSEAELEGILERLVYTRFTPLTADAPDPLRRMLTGVRERGYATEREELAFGRGCVAAPIRDASGEVVAATSISGPLSALDLDRREPELATRVIEMADHISHNLGYVTAPLAARLNGHVWAGGRG